MRNALFLLPLLTAGLAAAQMPLPPEWNNYTDQWLKAGGDWEKIPAVKAAVDAYRCPKPDEFAIVFSLGYTEDLLPADNGQFEQLVVKAKQAGFNVIHTTYTPERVEICRKHGVKLMIDFLDRNRHHVFDSPAKCREVCRKVAGDAAVWGYNVWNDHFGGREGGRERDIRNVRLWDPTHPAYCGGCANDGDRMLTNADCLGYYDFHWERGITAHFPHLLEFLKGARDHDSRLITLISGRPTRRYGRPADFLHRSLWSVNTSIACGAKGISWFLAPMDTKTLAWTANAEHIIPVNLSIATMTKELAKIGLPTGVYATPISRNNENQPAGGMPPGLGGNAFPAGFWIQPAAGEFVLGVFKDDRGRDAMYMANYNSQAPQDAVLAFNRPVKAALFDRRAGQWLPAGAPAAKLTVKLTPGGGELLRLEE